MACGCGGECCGQPKGMGFLSTESGGGGGDYWGFDNSFWDSGGGDWGGYYPWDYGFYDTGGSDAYVPSFGYSFDSGFFLPTNQPSYGSGNSNWQGLLDWWAELTGGVTANQGGTNPPLLGYCPGGTYHPLNDPYACVPFPPETPEFEKQQRAAAAHKAAQDALKAQQRAQQQQQQCPPNTGLVKNAQGKCVCPPPLQFSQSAGKCVLASQLTQADKEALAKEQPDWVKIIGIGALVLLGVKVLQK